MQQASPTSKPQTHQASELLWAKLGTHVQRTKNPATLSKPKAAIYPKHKSTISEKYMRHTESYQINARDNAHLLLLC